MYIICKLKECVNNNGKGKCEEYLPNVIPKLLPDSTECYQFEDEIIHNNLLKKDKNG